MRFPDFIKRGNTIAIAAPSFGAASEPYKTRLEHAVKTFESRGYNVIIGDCCLKSDGLGISTDPKVAAAELENFYTNDKISAIFSCGGGEMMCETLSFIDFDRIKSAKPKWFIGFSDNTNFIFPLATMCGTAGIYAQNAAGFGKAWEKSEEDTFNLLEGSCLCVHGYEKFQNPLKEPPISPQEKDPLAPYDLNDTKILTSFVSKNGKLCRAEPGEKIRFSGVLLGGCLDVLVTLSGTRFDTVKSFNNRGEKTVWVLEACDYNPSDIRRAFWHLRESGWFKNASGFIIGRPLAAFGQEIFGINRFNAVTDILNNFNVPVIFDADVGHIPPAMPLIIGSKADVFVQDNDISIKMTLK